MNLLSSVSAPTTLCRSLLRGACFAALTMGIVCAAASTTEAAMSDESDESNEGDSLATVCTASDYALVLVIRDGTNDNPYLVSGGTPMYVGGLDPWQVVDSDSSDSSSKVTIVFEFYKAGTVYIDDVAHFVRAGGSYTHVFPVNQTFDVMIETDPEGAFVEVPPMYGEIPPPPSEGSYSLILPANQLVIAPKTTCPT